MKVPLGLECHQLQRKNVSATGNGTARPRSLLEHTYGVTALVGETVRANSGPATAVKQWVKTSLGLGCQQ